MAAITVVATIHDLATITEILASVTTVIAIGSFIHFIAATTITLFIMDTILTPAITEHITHTATGTTDLTKAVTDHKAVITDPLAASAAATTVDAMAKESADAAARRGGLL